MLIQLRLKNHSVVADDDLLVVLQSRVGEAPRHQVLDARQRSFDVL
jgi:hypothetical protein